jgi:hypothetical protein
MAEYIEPPLGCDPIYFMQGFGGIAPVNTYRLGEKAGMGSPCWAREVRDIHNGVTSRQAAQNRFHITKSGGKPRPARVLIKTAR